MSFTYDWVNAPTIAQLRLMVGDTDASNPIFQDAEIQGALNANNAQNIIIGLSGYNVAVSQIYSYGRAAAMLLNSLGSTRARVIVLKVLDVDVNGATAAAALQKLGQSYIDQEASAGYFSVAEMGVDPFWMRERLYNQLLRIQT